MCIVLETGPPVNWTPGYFIIDDKRGDEDREAVLVMVIQYLHNYLGG